MIYIVAQIVCFLYAALLIGLYTLVVATTQLDPSLNSAETLLQDLTAIRIWIVIGGLAVYSWLLASKASTAMTLAVLATLAWVMFIEDYMVLDSVLFVAEHPLAQAAIIMRPLFLVGLTYICFKHFESAAR
jgi:hypothetical protein